MISNGTLPQVLVIKIRALCGVAGAFLFNGDVAHEVAACGVKFIPEPVHVAGNKTVRVAAKVRAIKT